MRIKNCSHYTWIIPGITILLISTSGFTQNAKITVYANQILHRCTDYMTGANLEDLNFQVTGGLYSQLIYGESFEEPVNSDGISRQWEKVLIGSANGTYQTISEGTFNGKQSQKVTFDRGNGEMGICNAGLNGWGINFLKDRTYEGIIRIQINESTKVYVSLRNADGTVVYAEKALQSSGGNEGYQRFEFTLKSNSTDHNGSFAVTLREPGSMTLGYAFLQTGEWGRYKGLPLKKRLVEALVDQDIKVIRFNGSMINPGRHDPQNRYRDYNWKKMIGPRDLRPPYQGTFNPYAGLGWGIIDFLDMCEATGILPIPGFNLGHTPQEMAEFVEYVNSPVDSEWGKRRAEDGHPEPYQLKHIQIGNEERINADYARKFKAIAKAVWEKDPSIILVISDWMYRGGIENPDSITHSNAKNLDAHVDIINFAKERGGTIWWDVHVDGHVPRGPELIQGGLIGIRDLKKHLSERIPDYDLKIPALEENAGTHDFARGLCHAHFKNELEREGDYICAAGMPNTVQPYGQYNKNKQGKKIWDQGNIFFTQTRIWFQPAYYVDQMVTRNWVPNVVRTEFSSEKDALDVTAKLSDDGKVLTLQVVNVEDKPLETTISIKNYLPSKEKAKVEQIKGELEWSNTLEEPEKIKPVIEMWMHTLKNESTTYTFPPYSFTVLRFE